MNKINKIKLVIEMPEPDYLWIKKHVMTVNEQIIANGKLLGEILDDLKIEIIELLWNDDAERVVTEIIDKHKAESEEE